MRIKNEGIDMTNGEKAATIIFFVCGVFIGGLGGLTLGASLTMNEVTQNVISK